MNSKYSLRNPVIRSIFFPIVAFVIGTPLVFITFILGWLQRGSLGLIGLAYLPIGLVGLSIF